MADVEIWFIDLARSEPALALLERDEPRLTAQDRRRIGAMKDPRRRAEQLAIYTAMRLLLERAGGARVAREPFVLRSGDKPRLVHGGIDFSLSHIDGSALIGLAYDGAIGVDLECVRPVRISERRREGLIAAAAGLSRGALPEAPTDARFLQAWTRIEAFAKAHGHGLSRTLTDLGVRNDSRHALGELQATAVRKAKAAGLATHDLNLRAGLFAAVALSGAGRCPKPQRLPSNRPGLLRLLRRH